MGGTHEESGAGRGDNPEGVEGISGLNNFLFPFLLALYWLETQFFIGKGSKPFEE